MASARSIEVALRFGIPIHEPDATPTEFRLPSQMHGCGKLILVTGPSGAGKTRLLEMLARELPGSLFVEHIPFPLDVPVIDAVAPSRPVSEAMGLLTACGLGEPRLWLRRFDRLSAGEQFRARLARALFTNQRAGRGVGPLLCDEFAAGLHRRLAHAISFNLRKLVDREGLHLIVATAHTDLAADLRPDCVIYPGRERTECVTGPAGTRPDNRQSMPSFAADLRIEPGCVADYVAFSGMHYRQRDQLGFVDRVFVMRDREGGALGVIVYGYPLLELAIRNRVTHRRFVRQPERLNCEVRVLKRLVVHPDARGCGLGHWLVRNTLPKAGARFVECLAAMGVVHPVFEKAGMCCAGVCEPPARRRGVLLALKAAGADPLGADFVGQVCRRPAVRRLVARAVFDWYRPTGGGCARVARQSPTALARTFRQFAGSEPAYFIWARDEAGRQLIGDGQRACGGAGLEGAPRCPPSEQAQGRAEQPS